MKLLFDKRWIGSHGIGRIAREIYKRFEIIPDINLLPVEGLPLFHPLDSFYLAYEIDKVKPNAYYSPGFNPPIVSSTPFVFTICDLIHTRFSEETGIKQKFFYNTIIRPAGKKSAFILTISEFSRQEIMEWGKYAENKVKAIPLGVGDEFTPDGIVFEAHRPYFLYVGNGKPHKNISRLLKAFSISGLAKEYDLYLVGTSKDQWASLLSQLKLDSYVNCFGIVPDKNLPSLYRGATAFVFPSLYEGFGLPPLEAMSCGTPVIVSNVTSLPEVVGDAGLFVDPLDIESIADGLKKTVTDQQLCQILIRKGLERAKIFSWDKTAMLIWKVLQEAAEGS